MKAIIDAKVMHKRFLPRVNQFLYRVFYIYFDLDELSGLKSWIFGLNRFNLFSFYNKDHGFKNKTSPKEWIADIMRQEKIDCDKFHLLTHPRVLGYVFNPVSFWFCYKNGVLKAVLCEVNNTFDEKHNYLIVDEEISGEKFYHCVKNFHVSPFLKVEGEYKFRFKISAEKIAIWINFYNAKEKLQLTTSLIGEAKALNDTNLLKNFVKMPFLTLKVIILIHFQALKILAKKIKYIPKPKPPTKSITKIK